MPRDSQRQRLYDAERNLMEFYAKDLGLLTQDDIHRYVVKLQRKAWYRKQFGYTHIRVKRSYRGRGSNGGYDEVCIGKDHLGSEMVVLHEVAHNLSDFTILPAHGPHYAWVYLFLVEKMMGKDVADRLRAAYLRNNVDWSYLSSASGRMAA